MRIETDESSDLISAEKVDGTNIYGSDGDKIGSVKSVMIGKRDGRVHHAIVSVGGLLGLGEQFHSVPWSKLKYDEELSGYRLGVTEEQLKKAPTFDAHNSANAYNREYQQRSYSHYGDTLSW